MSFLQHSIFINNLIDIFNITYSIQQNNNYVLTTNDKLIIKNVITFLKKININYDFLVSDYENFLIFYFEKYIKFININFRDINGNTIFMNLFLKYYFINDYFEFKGYNFMYIKFIDIIMKYFKNVINYNIINNEGNNIFKIIINSKYFNSLSIFDETLFNYLINIIYNSYDKINIFHLLCLKEAELSDIYIFNRNTESNYFKTIKFMINNNSIDIDIYYKSNNESPFSLSLKSNNLFNLFFINFDMKFDSISYDYIYRGLLYLNIINYNNYLEILKNNTLFNINTNYIELNGKNFLISTIECLNSIQKKILSIENVDFEEIKSDLKLEKIQLLLFKFKSTINVYSKDIYNYDALNYVLYPELLRYILDPNLKEIDQIIENL